MNDDTLIITLYIAAWSWHIIGVMFFLMMIFFYFIGYMPLVLAMMIIFMFCEFMAYKRNNEMRELSND